jgi:CBS domain-containing protein
MKMAGILRAKGTKVTTARTHTKIRTIAHRMKLERIGAVVITEDDKTVQGIVSERDVLYGLIDQGTDLFDMQASDLMSRESPTCTREDNIKRVMALMTQRRVRHVPVIEDGGLVGLVSIGDLVKCRLEEMEAEANVLRDYATAARGL